MRTRFGAAALACAWLWGAGHGAGGGEASGRKLTFWHIQNKEPMKGIVEAAVGRFRAAHPGLEVEVTALENNAFKDKLKVAMAAGSPPDVFHTWGGGALAADARAGRVLDLSARVKEERLAGYNPAALSFCRDRLFALLVLRISGICPA